VAYFQNDEIKYARKRRRKKKRNARTGLQKGTQHHVSLPQLLHSIAPREMGMVTN